MSNKITLEMIQAAAVTKSITIPKSDRVVLKAIRKRYLKAVRSGERWLAKSKTRYNTHVL